MKGEEKKKEEKKVQKKNVEEAPTGYIHVRARRGQATDSHSLAERVYNRVIIAIKHRHRHWTENTKHRYFNIDSTFKK
jgi:hypothetical protein